MMALGEMPSRISFWSLSVALRALSTIIDGTILGGWGRPIVLGVWVGAVGAVGVWAWADATRPMKVAAATTAARERNVFMIGLSSRAAGEACRKSAGCSAAD